MNESSSILGAVLGVSLGGAGLSSITLLIIVIIFGMIFMQKLYKKADDGVITKEELVQAIGETVDSEIGKKLLERLEGVVGIKK